MNNNPTPNTGEKEPRKEAALNAVQKAADTLKRRYSEDMPNASISFIPGKPEALRARRNKKKQKKQDKHHARTKVAFLRYSYYDIAFKYFVEQVLDADYVALPEATRHTLELGTKYSNDYVCAPFKHILGDYLEALERGADVLVQFAGPCRLGYYGELQEFILRDLGYEFEMLNFATVTGKPLQEYLTICKEKVNPNLSIPQGVKQFLALLKMVEYLDSYNDVYLEKAGFETEHGSFKRAREDFFADMRAATSLSEITAAYKQGMSVLNELPINEPVDPIRIGIIGDYFTAADAHSNLGIEEKFIGMGVSLARYMNITHRNLHYNEENLRRGISEYVKYDMGPTSTMNIAAAKSYAEKGFDGIVHLKSAGCTPEIDVMPVLQRISDDYHLPILYLSYDSQTSDTGLDTRLEAFYDMIAMRKAR
jgi:predicted nucleotide-binding protein (sugar kinase/HSP70/actin superfamily)